MNTRAISCGMIMVAIALTLYACRKDRNVVIEGQLLFSSSDPRRVANYDLELFQDGSSAIIFSNPSFTAKTKTDSEGRFRFQFDRPRGVFAGIPATTTLNTSLSGVENGSFPGMFRSPFPDSISIANNNRIFIAKKVERLIVVLSSRGSIKSSDTVILRVNTMAGTVTRSYFGNVLNNGQSRVLDTIRQVISTQFGGLTLPDQFINPCSLNANRRDFFINGEFNGFGVADELERRVEIVGF